MINVWIHQPPDPRIQPFDVCIPSPAQLFYRWEVSRQPALAQDINQQRLDLLHFTSI
jgi:hypothetical protein